MRVDEQTNYLLLKCFGLLLAEPIKNFVFFIKRCYEVEHFDCFVSIFEQVSHILFKLMLLS